MISCLTWLRRSRTPVALLAAAVALLGGALALGQGDGPDLDTADTVDEAFSPAAPSPLPPAQLSGANSPGVQPGPGLALDSPETATSASITADSTVTPGPPTVPLSPSGEITVEASPTTALAITAPPPSSTEATTASTSAPVATKPPSGCSDPWSDLAGCGWPGPGNTGPRSANCPNGLSTNSGATTRTINITESGAVISCQRITGALVIGASDVTVRDSIVTFDGGGGMGGAIVIDDGASATIDHVEIDGLNHTHACVWYQGTSVTIDAIHCHGTDDGVFTWARTAYSMTAGDNFTLRNSYFHSFTHDAANGHIDGFQTEGAANGTISHNTFLMPPDANSAVSIWNSAKNSTNITVTGNLMAGGQFTVYAEDYHPSESSPGGGNAVTNITFSNNVFSTKAAACVGAWGAWYDRPDLLYKGGPTDGWHRSGNYVLETGENIDHGNPNCR